ncbi:MAG: TetR family transcriptional regulator [Dehalococcoidia bacterium]|nr:TetR family transcriptional regulator [Dehalococcoidia bacterium]
MHYFGSKDGLFAEAVSLPIDPDELGERVFGPGMEGSGERLVEAFLGIWESEELGKQVRGVMRAAASNDQAAARLRAFIQAEVLCIPDRFIAQPDGRLRLELAATQLVGIALARYILGVEPLASTPTGVLVRTVGPVIQHYLSGDLGEPAGREEPS